MKHVVEFFDGRSVRGLLIDDKHLSAFLAKVDKLDPALGAIVLGISSEKSYRSSQKQQHNQDQWGYRYDVDSERKARVDQVCF